MKRGRLDARLLQAVGLCAALCSNAHAQQSARLDRYRPGARPEDGFALSGAETGPHLHYAAALHFDYAKDPLVFENVAGRSSSERVALVSDQLAVHAAMSLGLYDIALLYAELPVNLWMQGTALGNQPTATGFGVGDLLLGGRLALHHGAIGKAAVQLSMTAPTGEGGTHGRPGVAGDAGATFHPEVTSEIAAGPIVVLLDAGVLLRKDAQVAGTRFTDVLTFGAGVSVPIVQRRLRALFEAHGETPMDDVGNRAGSPLEALLGAKLTPLEGFTCGLAGGLGLLRGYGSPRARVVAMFGYSGPNKTASEAAEPSSAREAAETAPPLRAEVAVQSAPPPPPPSAPADHDKDGVGDVDDRCPVAPGPADNAGCPRHLTYDEKTGEIAFAHALRFEGAAKSIRLAGDAALDELVAFLQANPEMNVRIEAHVSRASGDARKAMPLSVQRASTVARFLVDRGVMAQRLEAVGCGSNRPIVADKGPQRAKNERVVLYVVHPLPEAGLRSSLGCEAEVVKRPEPAPPALREPEAPAPVHEEPRKPEPPAKPSPAPTAAASPPLALIAPSGSDSHRVDLAAGRIELLKPIRFDDGTAQLNPRSQGYLAEIAATLQANLKIQILIESHVAAEANAQASLALSQQRSKVVRKQLTDRGVAPSRMKAYGCGENRPLAPNNVPWGRKKNDRVELHVLDPAPSTGVHSPEGCSASE